MSILLLLRSDPGGRERSWNSIHSPEAVAVSKERGSVIIEAIDRYSSEQNRLPNALAELVPNYLESLSPPTAGDPIWRYERSSSGFYLGFGFGSDVYPGYWYNSNQPETGWQIDA